MATDGPSQTPTQADPEYEGRLGSVLAGRDFLSLLTVARIARKGAFTFGIYDNPTNRAALIQHLRQAILPLPFFEFRISPDRPNARRYLDDLTESERAGRAVVSIENVESTFPDSARWLDLQREVFAAHPHVLLVWIKHEAWGEIATLAPNFFSRHSGVFDLRLPAPRIDREFVRLTGGTDLVTGTVDDKRRSLALFESLLAEYTVGPDADPATRFDLLLRIAKLKFGVSDYDGSLRALQEAREFLTDDRTDSPWGELEFWAGLSVLHQGDYQQARARFEAGLSDYRRAGDDLGVANCIHRLGDVARELSDLDSARARYLEALDRFRSLGSELGEANCLRGLGDVARGLSDMESARKFYEEALPIFRKIGALLGEGTCLLRLGDVALGRSDHDAARALYEAARPIFRRVGSIGGEGHCLRRLGEIAWQRLDHDEARARFEDALKRYERIADSDAIGATHRLLARLARDDEERRRHVRAAREAWASIHSDHLVDQLRTEFGDLE